jgi:hypothetical protein
LGSRAGVKEGERKGEEKKEGGEKRFLFQDSDRQTVDNKPPRATMTNILKHIFRKMYSFMRERKGEVLKEKVSM